MPRQSLRAQPLRPARRVLTLVPLRRAVTERLAPGAGEVSRYRVLLGPAAPPGLQPQAKRARQEPEQPWAPQGQRLVQRQLGQLAWLWLQGRRWRPGHRRPSKRPRRIQPGRAPVAAINSEYKEPSYGNWRVPRSAGLGNLGAIGTAIVMTGLLLGITTFAIWGLFPGLAVLAVAGASALLLTVKDKHGQSVVDRFGTRITFRLSKSSGTNLYRSGPLGVTEWGMYQLPGLAAKSTLYEFTDSYKRPFAMLHVPTTSHFTVIFSTEPDGASLVDPEQVDAWVANWGGWLAGLADEAGLDAAAVTVETAPDSGYRLRNEVEMNIDPSAPEFAQAILREVVKTYPEGSATVRAWVSLTFNASLRSGSKKRMPEDVARDLASRIPGLSARLQSTGAGIARPMTAQELCEVVRVAYDPPAALLIDEVHAAGSPVSLTWG